MRTIVLLLVYVVIIILVIPVLIILYLLRLKLPFFWITKGVLKFGQKILGVRLEVCGLENIDKKKFYIFMPNHLSILDGPIMLMLIPQPVRVILKKEVFRIPVIGQVMRHVNFVSVDRRGKRGGKESIEKATKLMKEKGYSFLIFPEGTRSPNGKLQKFRRGGFFLAVNSRAPIVPVTITGTHELMPKGSFFIKRGKIRVAFYPTVSVRGMDRDSIPVLLSKVKTTILSGLNE